MQALRTVYYLSGELLPGYFLLIQHIYRALGCVCFVDFTCLLLLCLVNTVQLKHNNISMSSHNAGSDALTIELYWSHVVLVSTDTCVCQVFCWPPSSKICIIRPLSCSWLRYRCEYELCEIV